MFQQEFNTGSEGKKASLRYNFSTEEGNFAGKTVGEMKKMFVSDYSMPEDAQAFVGKTKVDDDHIIQEGEEIVWQKREGEKG